MEQWPVILSAVGGVFVVIATGALLRWGSWLTEEADATLLRVCIRVLFPCFLFGVLLGNPAMGDARSVIVPPLVGFGLAALGFGLAALVVFLVGERIGLKTPAMRRTFVMMVGLFNYGYLPIPVVEALFGEETLGVLVVHNVGVDVAMWSLAVLIVSGGLDRGWWKRVINPPLMAIVLTLGINGLGWAEDVPTVVIGATGMLGSCAIPIALLLIGATMTDEIRKADFREGWDVMTAGCLLRLGVLPAMFLLIAWLARDVMEVELQRVVTVAAAMPTGTFTVLLARMYGGDAGTAVRIALATSLVGLVTIPLWLVGGMSWLDLWGG